MSEDFVYQDLLDAMVDEFGPFDDDYQGAHQWYLDGLDAWAFGDDEQAKPMGNVEISPEAFEAGAIPLMSEPTKFGGGGISLMVSLNSLPRLRSIDGVMDAIEDHGFIYNRRSPSSVIYDLGNKTIPINSPQQAASDLHEAVVSARSDFIQDSLNLLDELEEFLE